MTAPAALDARRILDARARLLAEPPADAAVSGGSVELLMFDRAGSGYAVAAGSVVEVLPLAEPTPVPSTPPAVAGVVNHRGRIVAIVDLAALLPAASPEPAGAGFAVVVAAGDAVFGLRADAVSGVHVLDGSDLLPADRLGDQHDGVVCGLTAGLAAILDLDALTRDPRVRADDEAE